MNNNHNMLSQAEIDALLKGQLDEESPEKSTLKIEDYLSPIEQDALGEIANISFGSSATALSMLVNQKVDITTPTVSIIKRDDIPNEFPIPYIGVEVGYTQGLTGSNLLIINVTDAAIIADLMLGGTGEISGEIELNEIHLSAVQEAMNQMMGSSATSMSTIFNKKVDISPPYIANMDLTKGKGEELIPNDNTLVKVSFRLRVSHLIDSFIMQLLPIQFAKELVNQLLHPKTEEREKEKEEVSMNERPVQKSENNREKLTGNSYANDSKTGLSREQYKQFSQPTEVQPAAFADFDTTHEVSEVEARNLNMLYDIQLQVTVELGRTKKSIKEILELTKGSVIELDKLAGEPVEILVNNKLVARGEVVVIDENFGVRVTDIISKSERISRLK